ncbi:MAG TPA: PA0069 family radical SAM protein [Anaeromyxobacteraceae bacterium]|nr:PA0069 family radical SAM protein [Anaeromyxobacteraceae bacterium]
MPPRLVSNPPNPWLATDVEWLEPRPAKLEVYEDASREILSRNDSPDIGFTWSVNPYRGCLHGCAYCYARPYHEYLGFGAGTDFDTKVAVKLRAPELLREAFERPSWKGETVAFAGATDAWQPLEASYRLTRRCLEACAEYRNPVCVVSKAALLERDVDLLQELARVARASVSVSIPFLDEAIARRLEPLAPSPRRRLALLEKLAAAGLAPTVLVAPVVPGLDDELPRVLAAARSAGAARAAWQLLRLPGAVAGVFEERVRAALPERADRILHLVRQTRDGALYDPRFGSRFRGEGPYAETIGAVFRLCCARLGLGAVHHAREARPAGTFRRPDRGPQLPLFDAPPAG